MTPPLPQRIRLQSAAEAGGAIQPISVPCVVIHAGDAQVPRFVERVKALDIPGAIHGVRVLVVASPLIYAQANGASTDDAVALNAALYREAVQAFSHGRIAAHRVYQLDTSCSDPQWIPHSRALRKAAEAATEPLVVKVVAFPSPLQLKMTELLHTSGIATHPTQFTHELFVTTQAQVSNLFLFGLIKRLQPEGIGRGAREDDQKDMSPSTKAEAPCRAYFKMEESLEHHMSLASGAHVLDVGASPGGWTDCLLRHGARVVAVDPGELTIPLANRPVIHIQSLLEDAFPRLIQMDPFAMAVCDINVRVSYMAQLMARVAPLLLSNAQVVFTLKLGKNPKPEAVAQAFAEAQRVLSPDFHEFKMVWLHANTQNERTLLARKR